jgi:hypothetical protein
MPALPLFAFFSASTPDEAAKAFAGFEGRDWPLLIAQAGSHKVASLLRQRLRRFGLLDAVPESSQRQLRQFTRATAVRNLSIFRQIHEISSTLGPEIPLIILKGACLARTLYDDCALRPMGDVDVLARPEHEKSVAAALRRLGYRHTEVRFPAMFEGCHHDVPFVRANAAAIELHRLLELPGAPFQIDHDGLWARAVPAEGSPGCYYLAPEDQLLHLCLHAGYHHQFNIGLYAFIDIGLMCAHPALNWPAFIERARSWKAERCAALTLHLAACLAMAPVPAEVLAALDPRDFSPERLRHARESVYYKLGKKGDAATRFATIVARRGNFRGFAGLPAAIARRFHGSMRPGTGESVLEGLWREDLRLIGEGFWEWLRDPLSRRQTKARWRGARLSRWMERPQ